VNKPSVQHEYERVRDDRHRRLRDNWPFLVALTVASAAAGAIAAHVVLDAAWLGGLLGVLPLATILAPGPREVAWRKGAEGERAVTHALDQLPAPAQALHDRRMPGSRANIDHIVITASGVYTVDAKNYTGKVETRARNTELWVNGRNRTKLLAQAHRQTAVVKSALAAHGLGSVPVKPALCFVGAEWPLLYRPTVAGGVRLMSVRRLAPLTDGDATLTANQIARVTQTLANALAPMIDETAKPGPGRRAAPHPTAAPAPPPPASAWAAAPPRRPAPRPATAAAGAAETLTVTAWNRYGKQRLYVNSSDGSTLGYVDLATDEVMPVADQHRAAVRQAVDEHRRKTE
jgi:hypothetical protein